MCMCFPMFIHMCVFALGGVGGSSGERKMEKVCSHSCMCIDAHVCIHVRSAGACNQRTEHPVYRQSCPCLWKM